MHEDNEVLGIFALEDYTHMTPARGALLWAGFITAVLTVSFAVRATYPGKPSVPTEYEGGLEKELGGPAARRVSFKSQSLPRSVAYANPISPGVPSRGSL